MKCIKCGGKGKLVVHHNTGLDSSGHYWEELSCGFCAGTGDMSDEQFETIQNGIAQRKARQARGETLSEAATRMGICISSVSAVENGRKRMTDVPGYINQEQGAPHVAI